MADSIVDVVRLQEMRSWFEEVHQREQSDLINEMGVKALELVVCVATLLKERETRQEKLLNFEQRLEGSQQQKQNINQNAQNLAIKNAALERELEAAQQALKVKQRSINKYVEQYEELYESLNVSCAKVEDLEKQNQKLAESIKLLKQKNNILETQIKEFQFELETTKKIIVGTQNKLEHQIKNKLMFESSLNSSMKQNQRLMLQINQLNAALRTSLPKSQSGESLEEEDTRQKEINSVRSKFFEDMKSRQDFQFDISEFKKKDNEQELLNSFYVDTAQQTEPIQFKISMERQSKNYTNPQKTKQKKQQYQNKLSNQQKIFQKVEIGIKTEINEKNKQKKKKNLQSKENERVFQMQQTKVIKTKTEKNEKGKQLEQQSSVWMNKERTDPYFAHFVLTSQAVKIREDCQQILNIDIKPDYKEILQKRVPMHLWDQWIRNKLRDKLKRQKQQIK